MLKKSLIFFGLLASFAGHASYLERCHYFAEVKAIHSGVQVLGATINTSGKRVAAFEIQLLVSSAGSHHPDACQERVGQVQMLEVDQDFSYGIGAQIPLAYFHVSGRAPTGVSQSNTWSLNWKSAPDQ